MSKYGRLYEEASRIRTELQNYRKRDRPLQPLIDTVRLDAAKASVVILKTDLDALLAKWEELEKEMERCED
jgi:hypothetical protein